MTMVSFGLTPFTTFKKPDAKQIGKSSLNRMPQSKAGDASARFAGKFVREALGMEDIPDEESREQALQLQGEMLKSLTGSIFGEPVVQLFNEKREALFNLLEKAVLGFKKAQPVEWIIPAQDSNVLINKELVGIDMSFLAPRTEEGKPPSVWGTDFSWGKMIGADWGGTKIPEELCHGTQWR